MDILKGKEKLAEARRELREDFMAKSSRAAQKTKREQVMAMAKEACDAGENLFPLSIITVENVSAAIKAVGWTSGDQYINELKLMHIEAGWEVSQQLDRALADCKRPLRRNRGPVKRAPEFKLDDIEHIKWILTCRGPKRTIRPALSYAWAVIWMLKNRGECDEMERHLGRLGQKEDIHFHPHLEVRPTGLGSSKNSTALFWQNLP